MNETTGTTTEFPNCRYALVSETGMVNVSGKPMSLAHSLGVSLRGFLPSPMDIRISEPSLWYLAVRVRLISFDPLRLKPKPFPFTLCLAA